AAPAAPIGPLGPPTIAGSSRCGSLDDSPSALPCSPGEAPPSHSPAPAAPPPARPPGRTPSPRSPTLSSPALLTYPSSGPWLPPMLCLDNTTLLGPPWPSLLQNFLDTT